MSISSVAQIAADHITQKPLPPSPVAIALPDDDPDISENLDAIGAAEGQSFAIEYVDSTKFKSVRRITVWGIVAGSGGIPSLIAFCHERKAQRQFRIDRIQCFIDYDGEVFSDVPTFLVENFGMSAPIASRKGRDLEDRWRHILDNVRHDAVILAALSRCDGKTVIEEVEIATAYLSKLAEKGGLMLDDAEIASIYRYANRLRPTETAILRSLTHVAELGSRHIEKLLLTAVALVDADGKRHPNEISLINTLAQDLIGTTVI